MDDEAEVQLQTVEAELRELEHKIESLLARQQVLQAQREQLCRSVSANARAPKADWQGSFAWDDAIKAHLQTQFGLQAFRCSFDCIICDMQFTSHLVPNCWKITGPFSRRSSMQHCKAGMFCAFYQVAAGRASVTNYQPCIAMVSH